MFAVIFKATTGNQDNQYSDTVNVLRSLAFEKYNCKEFIAVTEGKQEVAISYWESEEDIRQWRADSQHTIAQKLGRDKWYSSYVVEVVEIKRSYRFEQDDVN